MKTGLEFLATSLTAGQKKFDPLWIQFIRL